MIVADFRKKVTSMIKTIEGVHFEGISNKKHWRRMNINNILII